jgi:uncharacterized circularly permuted ATP-grasp superfamily protein/uncharacterized alpha-E superfamily protein
MTVPDVVEAYARPSLGGPSRWDEMVDPAIGVRPSWAAVGSTLRALGPSGLAAQRRAVGAQLAQDGVTYRAPGSSAERPWGLDPVPLLLDAAEWARLEPGLAQRAELLDLVLTDLYGPRRLLAERLLPPEIVLGHAGFVRAVDGVRLPGERQLFLAAADLVRAADGTWTVVDDRTQAPSGTGYAMANRRAVSRALPGLFRESRVHRLGPFFAAMRTALQRLAPDDSEVPRIVLLTSGPSSETAFDQAFLASLLGFPLVQGADLVVRDGRVWQRSIGRLEPVDVVLRRLDAAWCDPLELRPDSQLGVPGLVEAARLGSVSVVNGLGTGVLENPALYPFLPRLAEVLLDQPLAVPSVPTWWCGDGASRRHVLAHLDSMVLKPIARQRIGTSRFGWDLSFAQREELARRIEADPGGWVGQLAPPPSTAPGAGAGGLLARPVGLRTFAVADGSGYRLLPGGLSRVSADPTSVVVRTVDGALSKDVWVPAAAEPEAAEPGPVGLGRRQVVAVPPRVAETLFWLGRYAERAEDVSRLVGVTDDLGRDVHAGGDPALRAATDVLLEAVLDVTSLDPTGAPLPEQLRAVVGDGLRVGTLAHDVRRLRDLAAASRDQLSTDTWTVLRDLDGVLAPFADGRPDRDVSAAMTALRATLMAFAGLAHESMVRDAGWHFLDAGRRVERALQLARLLHGCLARTHGPAVDALVLESALVAAESIITHRRRYPGRSGVDTALELLLLDADNPRSLAFQLERLHEDLRRIGGVDLDEPLQRAAGRLASTDCVALAAAGPERDGLVALTEAVVEDLHELAASIEAAHFAHLGTLQPLGLLTGTAG